MKTKNIAPVFKSNLDTKTEEFQKNKAMMLDKIDFLDSLLDQAELGGGKHHHDRLAKKENYLLVLSIILFMQVLTLLKLDSDILFQKSLE